MKSCLTALAFLALSTGSALAYPDETPEDIKPLAIGDAARPIDISNWVKGDKVTKFEDGNVYVVEFWATWCGPCRASMPHITKLQEQYKDYKVTFIGVSDEKLDTVTKFLDSTDKASGEKWSDIIGYRLTTDPDQSVKKDYFLAAGQKGIPCAFVIGKDQHIEWIGHPMEIEEPLEAVVNDKWDRNAFKSKWDAQQKSEEAWEKVQPEFSAAIKDENWDKAVGILDSFTTQYPDAADQYNWIKFQILATKTDKSDEAYQVAESILKNNWDKTDSAEMLNGLAWMIVDNPDIKTRNYDLAIKAASRASELTKGQNAAILDTLARCYFEKGDFKNAVKSEKAAAAISPEFNDTVTKYEDALAAKAGS